MRKPASVPKLVELGRVRLSETFFMRDFLYSDVAAIHGLSNIPDDPACAIAAGSRLCEQLLEPLQARFGRLAIRSAYRSAEVNALCNNLKLGCARNETSAAGHIWDKLDASGCMGATACIVCPRFADRYTEPEDWKKMAWWVHDHLPYSDMEFFPVRWAFNISWHEKPKRIISSRVPGSLGILTKPGMANYDGSHEREWAGLID